MADYRVLDEHNRLTPWSLPEHARYVQNHFYTILSSAGAESAKQYAEGYVQAEKAFDEAYEKQREALRACAIKLGGTPQELPDIEKISWMPSEATPVAPDVTMTPQKPKGRKPKAV